MPKKKGDKGGNPQPVKTPEFLAQQFKPSFDVQDVELAKSSLCVKLPAEWDAIVRPMPFRSEWLRKAIRNQLKADGYLDAD
ncbi:MAG: hypothetical protein ACAF41_11900 [Leptolyngbya sp. BL-A-14]